MGATTAIRLSHGVNRYGGFNEHDIVVVSTRGDNTKKPPVLVLHPHGASALSMFSDPGYVRLYRDLAEEYVVGVADFGGGGPTAPGVTWGNGYTQGAINAMYTMLTSAPWNARAGKMGLVPMSMGGALAFNYTLANPTRVAFIAGIVPMINMNDLRTYNATTDANDGVTAGSYASEIDAAYNGAWSDASYGSGYNPYYYRNSWANTGVRTAIWHSPADTVVRELYTTPFLQANPQIESYLIRNSQGTGPSHANAVVPAVDGLAVGGAYDFPKVADWCNQRRRDLAF